MQKLTSHDPITQELVALQVDTWTKALEYIQSLPYGRNANRKDYDLVLQEKKGTCSSKHALLKAIADLNQIPNVKLILGLYKMNEANTPNIGKEISKAQLAYIPEAHCYLQMNGKRMDVTSSHSEFSKIEKDILLEKEILPEQVADFKVDFHRNYLKNWIAENNIPYSFDEIWAMREACIKNLSGNNQD